MVVILIITFIVIVTVIIMITSSIQTAHNSVKAIRALMQQNSSHLAEAK